MLNLKDNSRFESVWNLRRMTVKEISLTKSRQAFGVFDMVRHLPTSAAPEDD